MARFGRTRPAPEPAAARAHRLALIGDLSFELVPMASLDTAVAALPERAAVSVTCSPTKGLETTQRVTEQLVARGFDVVPHVAARLVRDRRHARDIAAWCRGTGVTQLFVVGGDGPAAGAYLGAVELLGDLLEAHDGIERIGVCAYPDGHPFLSTEQLHRALHEKQRMLSDAGVNGWCSTQMCFDPSTIAAWIRAERYEGLALPVHLGVAGAVDRVKLLGMGVRLGIGDSLKYVRKNRAAVARMMSSSSYDPNDLLVPLAPDLADLGVERLHVFTFNQVAATEQWRQAALS